MKKIVCCFISLLLLSLIVSVVNAQSIGNWTIGNGWQGVPTPTPSPTPTPTPSNMTTDDAVGVAVAFGVIAISLAIVMPIIMMRRREEDILAL
jgi:hypothetical protein